MRIVLFFLVETVAALLIGFAALFLSFDQVCRRSLGRQSLDINGPQASLIKPSEARTGSLLLKTDDGYTDAARLASMSISPCRDRPSAPASRRSSEIRPGLDGGDLRLSAAAGRRGRHAEDGGRRSRHLATSRSGSRLAPL